MGKAKSNSACEAVTVTVGVVVKGGCVEDVIAANQSVEYYVFDLDELANGCEDLERMQKLLAAALEMKAPKEYIKALKRSIKEYSKR